MFQRIVERMTKELTDTCHDDHSSRRRRGTLVREKGQRGGKIELSWSGCSRSVARGARDYTREKAGLHPELYQRDVTDGTLSPCDFLQSFQEVVKFAQKSENAVQPVIGLGFTLISMEDVDHNASWRAFLNEVQQPGAHARTVR